MISTLRQYLAERKFTRVNESFFAEKNIDRALELYGKILSKKFGDKFFKLSSESFTRGDGTKGSGVRYINGKGFQIRWNVENKDTSYFNRIKGDNTRQLYLSSLDFWDNTNKDLAKPTLTVHLPKELNVVQILDKLCDRLKTARIGKVKAKDLLGNGLTEARAEDVSATDRWRFNKSRGLKNVEASAINSVANFNKALENDPDMQQAFDNYVVEILAGKPEENSLNNEIKKTTEKAAEIVYSDPKVVFKDIEKLTSFTAVGGTKSLVICGMPGVGKTYHVTSALEKLFGEEGNDWYLHKAMKIAPFALYKTMFRERKEVIVFDEADSILKNPDMVVQLKAALDTSGQPTMEYAAGTYNVKGWSKSDIEDYCNSVDEQLENGKVIGPNNKGNNVMLPSKYYFTGKVVFISNMPASAIDSAIMSRSVFVDVQLKPEDKLRRIESILLAQGYQESEVFEVVEALGEKGKGSKELTVRSAVMALKMKELGYDDWKRLASMYA